MRLSLFAAIGLILMAAGCCSREADSTSESAGKSAKTECKTGDCCSSVSRSALIQKAPVGESK